MAECILSIIEAGKVWRKEFLRFARWLFKGTERKAKRGNSSKYKDSWINQKFL